MYSHEFFLLFNELKNRKKVKLKRRTKGMKKVVQVRPSKPTNKPLKKKLFQYRKGTINLVSYNTRRPQHSVTMCNNFFTYFFLHFFKQQAVVLAKSLYKTVTSNALFKHEHQVLLYRTRFLK
jgi:aromatic ring-opening dioxygenase LigB subunit